MARSREEIQLSIQQVLVDEMATIGVAINPANWSKTNILRLLCFVFAVSAFILETLFDLLRSDVDIALRELKPHTPRWYVNKAKEYLHGFALPADSDIYDTEGYSEQQVIDAKIVKYSAVVEREDVTGAVFLQLKVAKEDNDDLGQLSISELSGVKEYIGRIKDAGVKIEVESNSPDRIKMTWKIFYDPLVLDDSGNRLDGTANDVVKNAIKDYLKQISFNGVYAIQKHEDYVQELEGVVLCPVTLAQSAYGSFEFTNINELIIPRAGYMRFAADEDLVITYIPFS
ncbi:hypothetical protein ABDK00_001685 [Niabella insulamsoli]|uniref:hypothetical protein n=1 Tax=Niabella insulamsoli TaxID=3144874 RepID=UPI0031FD61E4